MNTDYFCPECYVEDKDTVVNPIKNKDVRFCPECGWLIDFDVLKIQPNLKVKEDWLEGKNIKKKNNRFEKELETAVNNLTDKRFKELAKTYNLRKI